MTRSPIQDIRIWSIQHRKSKTRPWYVRWRVDGKLQSKSFRTRTEGDRFRSQLSVAQQNGERFNPQTGEPETWRPAANQQQVHEWARRWLADEWAEWSPRTRRSQIEVLAKLIPLLAHPDAPQQPADLRRYLVQSLPPIDLDRTDERERWLRRWVLSLGDLNEEILAEADRQLGLGDKGQTLAPNTAARYRRTARTCIRRAVELKVIPNDPWPPTPKGRSSRKALRRRKAVDIKRLPDPATMAAILTAIPSHQPGSRVYEAMSAISYFAGLRPSEVIMLRPARLHLPAQGWGSIEVVDADDGYDEPADTKTGDRMVPIPPILARRLTLWIDANDVPSDALLFRTRSGKRPALSNWNRALKRASRTVGHVHPVGPYTLRHACATTWLRAGVPLGDAAARLGHSVETLVSYYVGALQGDDIVANHRIQAALDELNSTEDQSDNEPDNVPGHHN